MDQVEYIKNRVQGILVVLRNEASLIVFEQSNAPA